MRRRRSPPSRSRRRLLAGRRGRGELVGRGGRQAGRRDARFSIFLRRSRATRSRGPRLGSSWTFPQEARGVSPRQPRGARARGATSAASPPPRGRSRSPSWAPVTRIPFPPSPPTHGAPTPPLSPRVAQRKPDRAPLRQTGGPLVAARRRPES